MSPVARVAPVDLVRLSRVDGLAPSEPPSASATTASRSWSASTWSARTVETQVRSLRTTTAGAGAAIHAPCPAITQRVWGPSRGASSAAARQDGGRAGRAASRSSCTRRSAGSATTPTEFVEGLDLRRSEIGGQVRRREHVSRRAASPGDQRLPTGLGPLTTDHADTTLDLSHTAASRFRRDAMAERLGVRLSTCTGRWQRLGQGRAPDPGTRRPAVQALLGSLAAGGFTGR